MDVEYDPIEPRFTSVNEDDSYSSEAGYGWEGDVDVSVVRRPTVSNFLLRGAKYIGIEAVNSPVFSPSDLEVPTEYLCLDFVAGRSPASFRFDLPDGRYKVTFLIGDVSDAPTSHGAMSVSVDGADVGTNLEIPTGEVREVIAEVSVTDGSLSVGLTPSDESEWILNGLIVAEMKPRVAHLPVFSAVKGEALAINATVSSPSTLNGARVFYRTDGAVEYRADAMSESGHIVSAVIPGAALAGDGIEYYIRAEDEHGNPIFFPSGGSQTPIATKLAEDSRPPMVIEHERVASHSSSNPLTLSLKVDSDRNPPDVLLHYRTVEQNADFRAVAMGRTSDGEFSATIPATDFVPNFDEMYYFELVDQFGNGTFYPDPFTGGRYFVINMRD